MKVGILHETKVPADRRCPLTPVQISRLKELYPDVEFLVQHSNLRVFDDEEFTRLGISVLEDVARCDILLGVKEVDIDALLPEKTYLFFSHTSKMQLHNRLLLNKMSDLKITLIDYEHLEKNLQRVVAFGYWAGIAGSYTALKAMGEIGKKFSLLPANDCPMIGDLYKQLQQLKLPRNFNVVITGEGRVANGVIEILEKANFVKVDERKFLTGSSTGPLYCQVGPQHYYRHPEMPVFKHDHFLEHGEQYRADFFKYARQADMLIACHYWNGRTPPLLTREQLRSLRNKLQVIADISCDINGPIASTIRSSTIDAPFYGFDPVSGKEVAPFTAQQITVMAVDNLPAMLPRESSTDFGNDLIEYVLPELFKEKESKMIANAMILKEGKLTPRFAYLQDFLDGKSGIK